MNTTLISKMDEVGLGEPTWIKLVKEKAGVALYQESRRWLMKGINGSNR